MERITDTLIRFAKFRLKSLQRAGVHDAAAVKAAQHIDTVAGYFSTVPLHKQINCIRQLEGDIRYLLPSEQSRFKKLRAKILDLIQQSHHHESMAKQQPT